MTLDTLPACFHYPQPTSRNTPLTVGFDSTSPTASTLQPIGLLDSVNGARWRQAVEALVRSGVRTVLVDCHDATFLDSAGVGALALALHTLQAVGGKLWLYNLNEQGTLLLVLTSMDNVFDLV